MAAIVALSTAAVAATKQTSAQSDANTSNAGKSNTQAPGSLWSLLSGIPGLGSILAPYAATKQSASKASPAASAINAAISLSNTPGLGTPCGANFYRCADHIGCFKYSSDCGQTHGPIKPACCCLDQVVAKAESNGWKYAGSFGKEGLCRANCQSLCKRQASKKSLKLQAAQCIGCTKGSCPKYVIGYSQQEWRNLSQSTRDFFNQVGRNANGYSSGAALCPSGDEDCFCRF